MMGAFLTRKVLAVMADLGLLRKEASRPSFLELSIEEGHLGRTVLFKPSCAFESQEEPEKVQILTWQVWLGPETLRF